MEQEPQRILRDEGVSGLNAVAVLEAVGRGAERKRVFKQLEDKWSRCALRTRYPQVWFAVLDASENALSRLGESKGKGS